MFTIASKSASTQAKQLGYEVKVDNEEKFIEIVGTNFALSYVEDMEFEIFTNYTARGTWKPLKNQYSGSPSACLNKIKSMCEYFAAKNKVVGKTEQTNKFDSVFTCPRCSGTGKIDAFSHINNGVCFLCGGAKKISNKTKFNQKVTAKYSSGYSRFYPEVMNKNKVYMRYSEGITITFDDSGNVYGFPIDDNNRDERRLMWQWLKDIGAELTVDKQPKDKGEQYSY